MLKSILYKSLKDTIKNYSNMFWIAKDIFWTCGVVCVCACVRCDGLETTVSSRSQRTHSHHRFKICRQTPTMHMINICEPLQVISVKVQVITPWWWILCDPKHVGVIFNYGSFKLLYNTDFNIYVLYKWVH